MPASCEGRPEGQDRCDSVDIVAFRSDVNDALRRAGYAHGASLAFTPECRAYEPDGSVRVRVMVHLVDGSDPDVVLRVLVDRLRAWRVGDTVEILRGRTECGGEAVR